ncbi:MAG: diaminopimelate epimerase [Planctomycetota bacterium]|jgi:diaminopimelate epimerase
MRFTKMEGLGNDYVYVNGFEVEVADPSALARLISDRHLGVGSDGLILILPSESADVRMEMFNADGSRAELCGNGLRCVGAFAHRHGLVASPEMTVMTGAGPLGVHVLEADDAGRARVRIELGRPRLDRSEIPMLGSAGRVVREPIEAAGESLRITAVSMGNPHAVTYVDDVAAFPVERIGPALSTHPSFPNRTNVEFVEVRSETEVAQRTWERGTGETRACGTGAAAVTVAGILTGRTGSPVTVHLLGGDLTVEWDGEGPVHQTGPATEVFAGEWPDHRPSRS